MCDGAERAWRDRWVGLSALLFGHVKNVAAFIEHGTLDAPQPQAASGTHTPEVARYMRAIELNGGRFLMPDDAERILAKHGEATRAAAPADGENDER